MLVRGRVTDRVTGKPVHAVVEYFAFTDNPRLKPERTASVDAGIEQRLFHNRVSLEGTYFYNRYYDLIVSLGGSLARLSTYQSDNLANSRAQGGEFAVRIRPTRWISIAGTYTLLESEVLSLNGSSGLAPQFFRVGQPLIGLLDALI